MMKCFPLNIEKIPENHQGSPYIAANFRLGCYLALSHKLTTCSTYPPRDRLHLLSTSQVLGLELVPGISSPETRSEFEANM